MTLPYTKPNSCPDDGYVKDRLHELLRARIDDRDHLTSALSLYIRRIHLGKLFSLYEAFKLVADLPGSILELGVYKGESLLLFAKLLEVLNPNDRSCRVIGFDNFAGFTGLNVKDGGADPTVDKVEGGWSPDAYVDDLKRLINVFDHDRMVGQKPRIELVEGNIQETVPRWAAANPGVRIRILNLDCDMYEPTLVALQHFYERVVPGGVVLLDEYAFEQFPGESAAVDEFFGGLPPVMRKFGLYSNPGAYFVKPGGNEAR